MPEEIKVLNLEEWQQRALATFKCYLDNGLYSHADFEDARDRVLHPPEWFVKSVADFGVIA